MTKCSRNAQNRQSLSASPSASFTFMPACCSARSSVPSDGTSRISLPSLLVALFYQIKNCSNIEFHHDKVKWYDGVKHVLFLKLIDKFLNNQLGITSDITKKQIDLIPHHIESKDNLIFMHFGFPHLPSLYAEKIYNQKSNNEEESYKLNLKLANDVLGIITSTLKKNQYENVLVILSSDHWLRSLKGPRPVLFNAKFINDSESFVLDDKLSNYYISELVMKYFNNEINSNRDIKKFFKNKPEIPSRYTPRFSM